MVEEPRGDQGLRIDVVSLMMMVIVKIQINCVVMVIIKVSTSETFCIEKIELEKCKQEPCKKF